MQKQTFSLGNEGNKRLIKSDWQTSSWISSAYPIVLLYSEHVFLSQAE